MAAITKRLLHLRPTFFHSYSHPLRHFSSSSDRDDAPQPEQSQPRSSLNDVKASLQNRPPTDRHQPPRSPFSFSSGGPPPSRAGSTDEIRNRLAEFRNRSAPPPPPGEKYVSLGDLYEKGLKSKGESSDAPSSVGAVGGKQSFDFLRHSLHKLEGSGAANSGRKPVDSLSLSLLMKDLKMKADPNGKLAAGSGGLNQPFFQKDAKGKPGSAGGRGEIGKKHEFSELGKKLKAMRPEKPKGKWFSLQEMSDRLAKVRKAEKEERERNPGLHGMHAVTGSLRKLEGLQMERQKLHQVTVGVLGSMGAALEEKIAGPPKDHLIENYFHPDNMSSAEKLKLELNKVRDEFKMSESDCGSARVQVAQLTTRIKHLSSVLHKKDKHSTRGLLAMVQRRKKLLKYLRRTDWDSYCLVLSKLGLRDNADVKA